MAAAQKRPELAGLFSTFLPNVPQLFVDVDRDKVIKQGIDIGEVYQTLQTFMGGYFVNYFNRFGRHGRSTSRRKAITGRREECRSVLCAEFQEWGDGSTRCADQRSKRGNGPEFTMRFNEYRSAQINSSAAPGYSSVAGDESAGRVFAQTMPSEMGFDYTGMSYPGEEGAGRSFVVRQSSASRWSLYF